MIRLNHFHRFQLMCDPLEQSTSIPITAQGGCMLRVSRLFYGVTLLWLLFQAAPCVAAQSQDLIVDVCAEPNKYWNKNVTLQGHVVKITPDPPGTNRGFYTFRDQSDKDIEIATKELPAPGNIYIVRGTVVQMKAGDLVPVVQEGTRKLALDDSAITMEETPAVEVKTKPAAGPARSAKKVSRSKIVKKVLPVQPVEKTVAPESFKAFPEASSETNSTLIIGLVVIAVLVIIVIVIVVMKKKPAAPAETPAPVQRQGFSPSAPVQASSGSATIVVGKDTEVVTRLGGELMVAEGQDRGRTYPIGKLTTLIGRAGLRKNDFELTDSTTSREQAKIIYNSTNRSFKIVNESATNPTRVNGSRIETVVLQDGDKIEFGNTVVRFKKA
jgi:hypothetical protein